MLPAKSFRLYTLPKIREKKKYTLDAPVAHMLLPKSGWQCQCQMRYMLDPQDKARPRGPRSSCERRPLYNLRKHFQTSLFLYILSNTWTACSIERNESRHSLILLDPCLHYRRRADSGGHCCQQRKLDKRTVRAHLCGPISRGSQHLWI